MEQSPPRRTSQVQIAINPALVEACAQLNKAFGRAYLAAGAELARQFSEMMQRQAR